MLPSPGITTAHPVFSLVRAVIVYHWFEVLTIALFLGIGWGIGSVPPPATLLFFEGDLTLSRAHPTNTVSNGALAGLAAALPICVLIVYEILAAKLVVGRGLRMTLPLSCGLALSVCICATNVIKIYAAIPRPSFFARCDYKGYASAIATQNFTAYRAAITVGNLGSLSFCEAATADVNDAVRSFPSGHSSLSFSGLFFLTLSLRALLGVRDYFSMRALIAGTPLALSTWIAVTRLIDGAHSTADVATGVALGLSSATAAWLHAKSNGYIPPSILKEVSAVIGVSNCVSDPNLNDDKLDHEEKAVLTSNVTH